MSINAQIDVGLPPASGWVSRRTASALFDSAVKLANQNIAVIDPANRTSFSFGEARAFSYTALDTAVWALTCELYSAGIRRGDIVTVQMPNIIETISTFLAVQRLGAVLSPVPMHYGFKELEAVSKNVPVKAYISTDYYKGESTVSKYQAAFGSDVTIFAFGEKRPEAAQLIGQLAADIEALAACEAYVELYAQTTEDAASLYWSPGPDGIPTVSPRSHSDWLDRTADTGDQAEDDTAFGPFPCANMAVIGPFFYSWLKRQNRLVL
ncbi:MAG: AMP-binding protein [Kordiimonadaceae bacterium]|nr:AMP-binding protein [Kordiimonadaceae bacterium]